MIECKDTQSSYITNSIDNSEKIGFVQNQVGHTNNEMIIEHYYKHIPAPQNGKGLEKAFSINMDGEEIVMEQDVGSE